MYRNVPLYNIAFDVVSIAFFVAHKNELIGYKDRLSYNKPKDEIVLLYGENPALFPKLCLKYTGINFLQNRKIYELENFHEAFSLWTAGKQPHVFSVNDLDGLQCETILEYGNNITNNLPKEYENLVDKYLGNVLPIEPIFHAKSVYDLALDYYFPIIMGSKMFSNIERNIFVKWLAEHSTVSWLDCTDAKAVEHYYIEGLKKHFDEKRGKIEQRKEALLKEKSAKEIALKNEETMPLFQEIFASYNIRPNSSHIWRLKQELEQLRHVVFSYGGFDPFSKKTATLDDYQCKLEEVKKAEKEYEERESEYQKKSHEAELLAIKEKAEKNRRIRELKKEISNIDEKINSLQEEFNKEKQNLAKKISENTDDRAIISLFEHQDEINKLINDAYEVEYNQMWLNSSDEIRERESWYTNRYSIGRLLGYHVGQSNIFCHSIKTRIPCFSKRVLFSLWTRPILDQREEKARLEEEKQKTEQERIRQEEEARRERYRYNERNKHQRDAYIHFDAKNHIYTVNGITLQSVTNFVEGCFPKFEAEIHAKGVAARMGISVNDVLAMWNEKSKESRDLGTLMHQKIEKYYQGVSSVEDDSFMLFKQFASQISLQPYRTEWTVYDTKYNIAGTIDFVDYQNGRFTIYDWKRSNKIISNGMPVKSSKYKTMGLSPLEHLGDCPYYHYALQLSLYRFILERNYNLRISDLRLGIFHPDYNKPYVLRMPYLEDEIKTLMDLRADVIL